MPEDYRQTLDQIGNTALLLGIQLERKIPIAVRVNLMRQHLRNEEAEGLESPFDLSEESLKVLQLMTQGLTNEEIATSLSLPHHTVASHVRTVLQQVGAGNRREAALAACEAYAQRPNRSQFIPDLDVERLDSLSPDERKVFDQVKEGLSNEQIASELGISSATVASQVKEIYKKAGCSNRLQISVIGWLEAEKSMAKDPDPPVSHEGSVSNQFGLSPRTVKIWKLIVLGNTDKEIARQASINHHTVNAHRSTIIRQTEVSNQTIAATLAYSIFKDELARQLKIDPTKISELTEQETRVLCGLSTGMAQREIAGSLQCTSNVIQDNVRSVKAKLGIKPIQAGIFVMEASEAGLLDVESYMPQKLEESVAGSNPRYGGQVKDQETLEPVPIFVRGGYVFSWERHFVEEANRAITILKNRGYRLGHTTLIKIDNLELLESLRQQGLIGEVEASNGELNFRSAVTAIMARTKIGKVLTNEYRPTASRLIGDAIAQRLEAERQASTKKESVS